MGKLGEAVVEIYPEMRGLDSGLKEAEGKVRGFAEGAKGMLGGLAITGGALGLAAAGGALFDAAKKAADLGESLSKTRTTFGGDSKSIEKYADDMADRFGIVRRESIDAATAIGLVGQAAGLSTKDSAALGVDLAKLAADFSSFHNTSFMEALTAIRSGLVGESEPLRRFGLMLNEDAVKAEALRLGLIKLGGAMSESVKVRARASLIQNAPAAKVASGDLERTADSAVNRMRKLEGDIENFKTAFGQALIGPLTEGIKLANDLGKSIGAIGGGAGGAAPAAEWAEAWIAALRTVGAQYDSTNHKLGFKAQKASGRGAGGSLIDGIKEYFGGAPTAYRQAIADKEKGVQTLDGATIDAQGNMLSGDEGERKRQMKERREAAEAKAKKAEADRRGRLTKGERDAEDKGKADRAERALYDAGQAAATPKRGPLAVGAGSDAANDAAEARRHAHRQRYTFDQYRADRERSGQTPEEYDAARKKTGLAPEAFAYQQRRLREKKEKKADQLDDVASAGRGLGQLARGFAEKAVGALTSVPAAASKDRGERLLGGAGIQNAAGALGPLSGPAGLLLRGGLAAAGSVAAGAERGRESRARMGPSQTMSADDFAGNALNQVFDNERDKQLAAQEKANEKLDQVKDVLGRILDKTGNAAGAILKGRS